MGNDEGGRRARFRRVLLERPQTIGVPLVVVSMTLLLGGLALGPGSSRAVLTISLVLAAAAVAVYVPSLRRRTE